MQNVHKYSIFFSFFGLWMVSILSSELQVLVGFFFIFTFGILHGTNDLLLLAAIKENVVVNQYLVLANYLVVILITIFCLKFLPLFTVFLFIIFSAYHFGEQHFDYLQHNLSKITVFGFNILYGLFVLSLLFYANASEVSTIINDITSVSFLPNTFFTLMIVVGASLIVSSIYIGIKCKSFSSKVAIEIFYLVIFAIIFKSTTLIWGFALYFILWHSIPSMFSQIEFIYGTKNKNSFLQYCTTGAIFWVVSLLGMVVIYFMFSEEKLLYTLFFSFIIAITFPHVVVIQKMFSKKNQQTLK